MSQPNPNDPPRPPSEADYGIWMTTQPSSSQPPYPYAPPAVRPTSGLAVASLICGIAGFVLCFTVLPSIAAVVLGHMALKETANGARGGHGQAIAGLILGYVVVCLAGLYIL